MKRYFALLMSVVLVVLDQLFKLAALEYLKPVDTVPLIDGVLHLTYLENRGMAFGMMQGQKWLLIWGTALVLLILILALMMGKVQATFPVFCLGIIIGGGVGNLIDRVYRGYVVDYIHVKIIDFAIFNFADMCVVVGTALLVIYVLFYELRGKNKEESGD